MYIPENIYCTATCCITSLWVDTCMKQPCHYLINVMPKKVYESIYCTNTCYITFQRVDTCMLLLGELVFLFPFSQSRFLRIQYPCVSLVPTHLRVDKINGVVSRFQIKLRKLTMFLKPFIWECSTETQILIVYLITTNSYLKT